MAFLEVILTLLFALFWLAALAGHAVLFKILQTPADRNRLGLPQGHLTLVWLLLLSITAADLVALLLAIPFSSLYAIFNTWPFGLPACKLSPYLKIASVTVSSYSLLGLLVVCYEMVIKTSRPPPTTFKSSLLVGSIWVLALVTAVPMFTYHRLRTDRHFRFQLDDGTLYEHEEYLQYMFNKSGSVSPGQSLPHNGTVHEQTFCTMSRYVEHSVGNFYLLVQFIVPLIITVFIYIKVSDEMNRKVAKRTTENNNNNNNNNSEVVPQMPDNDVKFVRMILITSLAYHLLWAPNNLNNFFFFIPNHMLITWIAFTFLSQSTHFIMPFLYMAINTNFQSVLKTLGKSSSTDGPADSTTQVGFSKMVEEEAVREVVL